MQHYQSLLTALYMAIGRLQMDPLYQFWHFLACFTLLCCRTYNATLVRCGLLKQLCQTRSNKPGWVPEQLLSNNSKAKKKKRNWPLLIHSTTSSALFWNTLFTSSGRIETSFVWISTKPLAVACAKWDGRSQRRKKRIHGVQWTIKYLKNSPCFHTEEVDPASCLCDTVIHILETTQTSLECLRSSLASLAWWLSISDASLYSSNNNIMWNIYRILQI